MTFSGVFFRDKKNLLIWCGALALALGFLAVDSSHRILPIREVYGLNLPDSPVPQRSAQTASGFQFNQHRLILPSGNVDGYHWIMYTERMLAGDGLRIRHTLSENPPQGREVHWSGSLRWWLASLAWTYQRFHPGIPLTQALEQIASSANALALALFMLALTPLIARRLGPFAGALFALGCVAIYPFYQYSSVGMLDHHAFAAMSGFAAALFVVAGGGGWVRSDVAGADPGNRHDRQLREWLADLSVARRWFIASGIAIGIGLWISAATLVPIALGLIVGALVSILLVSRDSPEGNLWRAEPSLWRTWGIAACLTSIAFYLIEYFPSHFGWRLEVNHPFYAVVLLAAGDLLYRVGRARTEGLSARTRHWLMFDSALIALLALSAFITRETTFKLADPFLLALHEDYILEFRGLSRQLALNATQALQVMIPLLILPLSALLWPTTLKELARSLWRALVIAFVVTGIAFVHILSYPAMPALLNQLHVLPVSSAGGQVVIHLLCLVPDALAFAVLFLWPISRHRVALRTPLQALLVLTILPALLILLLSFRHVRWFGIDSALWLATLITGAGILRLATFDRTRAFRFGMILCLVVILLPFPAFTFMIPWRQGYPTDAALPQIVVRDVSYHLRARVGEQQAVVLGSPTTTSELIYFGGFQGLGTLYWENLEGLEKAATLYGAPTLQEAKRQVDQSGVTHVVIFSWDPFAAEYGRLARGERFDPKDPQTPRSEGFISQLLQTDSPPPWLVGVPYDLPDSPNFRNIGVRVYEVNGRPAGSRGN